MVLNVILAILVLSIIVIVHEFGHFIIAKANGITVVEFSILSLIHISINDKVWSDADIATYEEHKSNMQYLFNFLSKEAAAQLAELALADEANIVADKIFNGLVEGRVSKQLKEN